MKALLDTNFLMIPGEFRVDIFSGLLNLGYTEIFTLDIVVRELEKFSTKGGKTAKAARIALELVRNCEVSIIQTKGDITEADAEILRLARNKGCTICTQDRELLRRAKAAGMRVITMRQQKYLAESGGDF
jgi:rRNA-processing protein FCF1